MSWFKTIIKNANDLNLYVEFKIDSKYEINKPGLAWHGKAAGIVIVRSKRKMEDARTGITADKLKQQKRMRVYQ